jgi:excinuclease UvrABC nuclease subunit
MSYWQALNVFRNFDTPAVPGCYVIYFDGVPVYVGQSNNLRSRLSRHNFRHSYACSVHTPWGELPNKVVITAKYKASRRRGDWAMWELRLIHRLKPDFNQTHKGRAKSVGADG